MDNLRSPKQLNHEELTTLYNASRYIRTIIETVHGANDSHNVEYFIEAVLDYEFLDDVTTDGKKLYRDGRALK